MSEKHTSSHDLLNGDDALVLVIDMQERLLPVIAGQERVVGNALRLIRFASII